MAHGAPRYLSFVMAAAAPRGGASFGGGADGVGALSGHGFNASGYFVRQRFGFGRLAAVFIAAGALVYGLAAVALGDCAAPISALARQPVMRHKRAITSVTAAWGDVSKGNLMSEPKPRVLSGVSRPVICIWAIISAPFAILSNCKIVMNACIAWSIYTPLPCSKIRPNWPPIRAKWPLLLPPGRPENHIVFNQAQVPQHAELAWVLMRGEDGLAQSDDAI